MHLKQAYILSKQGGDPRYDSYCSYTSHTLPYKGILLNLVLIKPHSRNN